MDIFKELQEYLKDDLIKVNQVMTKSLKTDEKMIFDVGNHLASAGGKRIRPLLTILSSKIFGYSGDKIINLAASVEFIHMATLLHDDVVDESTMRRFIPTANTIWGSKASILVGDYLFSQAFRLIVSTGLLPALRSLSDASAILSRGEVSQLEALQQEKIFSEEEYFKIINAKTAELFSASCEIGAIVAGEESSAIHLRRFGKELGIIFQIIDDFLDYFSDSETVGKNIGDDFFEGKITLPLIWLKEELSEKDAITLKNMMSKPDRTKEDLLIVQEWLKDSKVKDRLDVCLKKLALNAKEFLNELPLENKAKDYMASLVDFSFNRTY